MNDKTVFSFPGKQIEIEWDSRLCIHIGECSNAKGDLFVGDRDPWCNPDLVSIEEGMEICERCPSGALTYTLTDASAVPGSEPEENSVQVVYNGPLYLRGELEIEGAPEDMPGLRSRAALCRCGSSENKPFCDNSHLKIHFEDYGAVGESGEGLEATGGPLKVQALKDGPLVLSGNVSIVAASGRVAWRGTQTALCRCGHSLNKPFCDGSHTAAKFESD